jgi:hypothetical protein
MIGNAIRAVAASLDLREAEARAGITAIEAIEQGRAEVGLLAVTGNGAEANAMLLLASELAKMGLRAEDVAPMVHFYYRCQTLNLTLGDLLEIGVARARGGTD